jgi:hypothetical protein
MQNKENKIIEYIAIAIGIYFLVWFWPILFGSRVSNNDFYPKPYVYGVGALPPAPNYNPSVIQEVKLNVIKDTASDNTPQFIDTKNPQQDIPSYTPGDNTDIQVACTMEAKICADGSYVGRSGPNCEFSKCPDEK